MIITDSFLHCYNAGFVFPATFLPCPFSFNPFNYLLTSLYFFCSVWTCSCSLCPCPCPSPNHVVQKRESFPAPTEQVAHCNPNWFINPFKPECCHVESREYYLKRKKKKKTNQTHSEFGKCLKINSKPSDDQVIWFHIGIIC